MELRVFLYFLIVATATCGESIRVDNKVVPAAEKNYIPPSEYSKEEYDTYTTTETPKPVSKTTPPPTPKLAAFTHKTTKKPQIYVAPPQYSRVFHDAYKTTQTPAPPMVYTVPPAAPSKANALRAEDYKKPVAIKPPPPTPVIPRTANEAEPFDSQTQTFSVPKSVVQTFSQDSNADPDDGISQPQPIPITASYLPPVAVYNPYPYVVPGGYPLPAYPRPSYPRFYNVDPLPYRTLGYSPPLAYPVPSPRNFAYAYPSPSGFQVVYSSPSIGFGDGLPPIQYNGFGDYDDFLKKKKRK